MLSDAKKGIVERALNDGAGVDSKGAETAAGNHIPLNAITHETPRIYLDLPELLLQLCSGLC
jgi:hypothetical protein